MRVDEGYGWLPNRRRRAGRDTVRVRLCGKPAVAICGPGAPEFFCDNDNVRRHVTSPVPPRELAPELVARVATAWDETVATWTRRVVLFDEASRILTAGVSRWAGIRQDERLAKALVADDVDMLARFSEDLRTVMRQTVSAAWFVSFAAHALQLWPEHREPLAANGGVLVPAFVRELRRFYPYVAFESGRAVRDLTWQGEQIPEGSLVLLDVYGHNHHPDVWEEPYRFDPTRFFGREHEEHAADRLLRTLVVKLARLDYVVPKQDLSIPLRPIPTRPRSGFVLRVRPPAGKGSRLRSAVTESR